MTIDTYPAPYSPGWWVAQIAAPTPGAWLEGKDERLPAGNPSAWGRTAAEAEGRLRARLGDKR